MALIRTLSSAECLSLMRQLGFGRLLVLTPPTAYAVPMLFLAEEQALSFYTLPGRKLDALRSHPTGVLAQFDEIRGPQSWRSATVTGRFEEAERDSLAARLLEAFEAMPGIYARIAPTQIGDSATVFGRIAIDTVTGRAMNG